jgi:hypothetical protein
MRDYFKNVLQNLNSITGNRQLENMMAKGPDWKKDVSELLDLLETECNTPPFDKIAPEVKERVISKAILEGDDFIGLNQKFVRRALNAWWQVHGGKILEARDKKPEDVYKPVIRTPEENAKIDALINEYRKNLEQIGQPKKDNSYNKEIRQEAGVRSTGYVPTSNREYILAYAARITAAREKIYRERHPEATDEEVNKFLDNTPL